MEVVGTTYDEDKLVSIVVKVLFSKVNLQKFEPRSHSNLYSVSITTGEAVKLNDIPVAEAKDKSIVVKEKRDGQLLIIKTDPKNEKALYLEHWDQGGYQTSLKLPDWGSLYNHPVFGGISWSKENDKIVFIAEKKATEAYEPYWDSEFQKEKTEDEKKKDAKVPHSHKKWLYNDKKSGQVNNFGETLTNKTHSVIVVYDLAKKKISILDIQDFKDNGNLDSDGLFYK